MTVKVPSQKITPIGDNNEYSAPHPTEEALEKVPSTEEAIDMTGPLPSAAEQVETTVEASRYEIHHKEESSYIISNDAPKIRLFVERGLTVTPESRKKYSRQSIFIDGAYEGAPFLDNEARQYSLDHHAGCVRAFTLASCEQAAVLLLQGLPLAEGTWKLYVNAPDLDALLAAWLLMNHKELIADPELLAAIMPFVRVEGVIDAHGFDKPLLSGMPLESFEHYKEQIDELLDDERAMKSSGSWATADWLAYSEKMLKRLDQRLYPQGHLSALVEITEVAQANISAERIVVLCSSRKGIYAVEQHLKRRYEKQLAVIILDSGDGTFTLRQTDPFLEKNLDEAYEILNHRDPAVIESDEQEEANHWGGSSDIGGSPRAGGSQLKGEEVLGIVQNTFAGGGWFKRMMRKMTRRNKSA